jgi:hypothetical protein
MPQHLGVKHKVKADADSRAVAIRSAMLAATSPDDVDRLAAELKEALAERASHEDLPDNEWVCAFHLENKEHAVFTGRSRVVYAVAQRLEFDDDGESVSEQRFQRFMYFTACPACEANLQLKEHLTE